MLNLVIILILTNALCITLLVTTLTRPRRGGYGYRRRSLLQDYRYRVHRKVRRAGRRVVDAVALSGPAALIILIAPHIH